MRSNATRYQWQIAQSDTIGNQEYQCQVNRLTTKGGYEHQWQINRLATKGQSVTSRPTRHQKRIDLISRYHRTANMPLVWKKCWRIRLVSKRDKERCGGQTAWLKSAGIESCLQVHLGSLLLYSDWSAGRCLFADVRPWRRVLSILVACWENIVVAGLFCHCSNVCALTREQLSCPWLITVRSLTKSRGRVQKWLMHARFMQNFMHDWFISVEDAWFM